MFEYCRNKIKHINPQQRHPYNDCKNTQLYLAATHRSPNTELHIITVLYYTSLLIELRRVYAIHSVKKRLEPSSTWIDFCQSSRPDRTTHRLTSGVSFSGVWGVKCARERGSTEAGNVMLSVLLECYLSAARRQHYEWKWRVSLDCPRQVLRSGRYAFLNSLLIGLDALWTVRPRSVHDWCGDINYIEDCMQMIMIRIKVMMTMVIMIGQTC